MLSSKSCLDNNSPGVSTFRTAMKSLLLELFINSCLYNVQLQ
ncbi:hypothetical protein EG68_01034 [Paragonimus skrjabini miyazakii]|uniref:Uncharacterized protein n=1 Tax=Paragonimus skrjabini miyazakii TaxID=59628 RepID=A0A8S9Z4E9_9TREM|nr:hypothetical protein EG68_01034 [Paragonimus skrjabini miyazakii]